MDRQRRNPRAANPNRNPVTTLPKVDEKFTWLKQSTGPEIISIHASQLEPDSMPVESKSGFEELCSYNWHKDHVPAIYVPGAPPSWKSHDLPITLPSDKGGQYIDQNAHKVPDYPFEPMFGAMSIMKPDFDFGSIEVVTNRNSLRKLLDFAGGRVWDPFRIDLNIIKNTLIMTRRERRTREITGTHLNNMGYGKSFEDHFTSAQKELEDSSSHHRVARYKLGDLDCVVRYEVDAWMQIEGAAAEKIDQVKPTAAETPNSPEDLLDSLEGLSLTAENESSKAVEKVRGKKNKQTGFRATKIVQKGSPIESARLAELKSKSKPPKMKDLIPQLWFGRIPYLIVGIHEKGTFNKISITETANEFQRFEEYNQDRLRKLVGVIKFLRDATIKSKDKACVVVCDKSEPLRLSIYASTNNKPVLPDELINAYWREPEV